MKDARAHLAIAFAAVALGGCVAQPQSPEEFKQVISDGSGRKESYMVKRTFEAVVKSIKDNADRGFNATRESTLMSGYQMEHSVVIYRCQTSLEEGRAQLVIQKKNRPKGIGAP